MVTKGFRVSLVLVMTVARTPDVDAYEPEAHREIAQQAVSASATDARLTSELGLAAGSRAQFLGREARQLVGDGAASEDSPQLRASNHFHNPLLPWETAGLRGLFGLMRGQSSVLWQQNPVQDSQSGGGSWSWHDARRASLTALRASTAGERERAFADTFVALGHLTHLIQDASVPAHTRNDPHLFYEGYEAWVETVRGGRGPTPQLGQARRGLFLGILNADPVRPRPSIFTPTGHASAPAPVARLIDADVFDGLETGALRGTAQGMAEYSNGNFVSDDTIFRDFALPRPESLGAGFFVSEGRGRRRYFPRHGDGEVVPHFVAEGTWFERLRFRGRLERGDVLTDLVYQDYATLLIPRAVGYSAALLDYFFRGRLEFELFPGDDDAQAKLIGFNRSDDALGASGELTLYWDDVAGARQPVEGPAPTLASTVEKNAALPEITFRWPDGAQRFVLAYRGPLGLEADAVVGKVAENPTLEQVYWSAVLEDDQYVFPWFLRTAEGVFVLPFEDFLDPGQTAHDVRWGERDNMLGVQTFQGDDGFTGTAFVVFTLDRAEGSSTVPTTGRLRYGRPVARIAPRQVPAATVPLHALANLDLGTTVTVRHTHTTRQFVASYERRVSPTEATVSPAVIELLGTSVEPYTQTFGLRVDRAHFRAACGEHPCPHYSWSWEDFALTADGDILLLVTVREGTLPDALREIPALGHQPDGTVGPVGGAIVVPFEFPADSPFGDDLEKLRGVAWVNLSQGAVLAKTMSDSVTLAQTTEQDGMRQQVHSIVENDRGETVTDEWTVVLPQPCSDPGVDTVSVERKRGVLSLAYDGLYRKELRDLDLERDFAIRSSAFSTFFCFGAGGLRVTTVVSAPDPFPYTITNFELDGKAVEPGSQALSRFPLIFTRRSGEDSQLVLWDALGGSARRLLRAPAPDRYGPAMANRRWALVDDFPLVHLVALDGSGAFDLPWADQLGRPFGDAYTLVAPDRLYNAVDDKFHAVVGQELKPTKRPGSLAPVDPADHAWVNAPFWPYQVVRPK